VAPESEFLHNMCMDSNSRIVFSSLDSGMKSL